MQASYILGTRITYSNISLGYLKDVLRQAADFQEEEDLGTYWNTLKV